MSWGSSGTNIRSPYGGLPGQLAGMLQGSQLGPLIRGLGFGGGQNAGRFDQTLENATGPLADFIRDVRGFAPDVINQAQGIGDQVAGQTQLSYDALRGQIDQSLANLPHYQAAANQGLSQAQQATADAFSPIRDSALFQRTSQDVLRPLQANAAGRGLLESGGAQQQEQDVLQNLGLDFAQNQLGNQQNALGGLTNMIGLGQGLNTAGIDIAGQYFPALQNFQTGMNQRWQNPLQASGGLLSLLQGGNPGAQQLTQTTSPQLGATSKNGAILCIEESTCLDTPAGPRKIGALQVGDFVDSLTLDGVIVVAPITHIHHHAVIEHEFASLDGSLITPAHPTASGIPCGSLTDGRITLESATTVDVIVDSPTGFYSINSRWYRSTIDPRHAIVLKEVA